MARNTYQYGTSPRKLEPVEKKAKKPRRGNLKVVKDLPRQEVKVSKAQKKKQRKVTCVIIALFIMLLP